MKMNVPYPYGKPYSQPVVFTTSHLETLIREKAIQLSYNTDEQHLIQNIADHLRKLVKDRQNFGESFSGGSFKRGTLAKNLGIVNLYFEFIGSGTPHTALRMLRDCMQKAHPDLNVRQENSTIKLEFQGIPYTLTPYLKSNGDNIKIPNETLSGWKSLNIKLLEVSVRSLTMRSKEFLHLIKVIKLWNSTHKTGLKNYRIEELVCNLFISYQKSGPSLDYWLYNFFNHYRYRAAAEAVRELMKLPADHPDLKTRWEQFIENKQTKGWA
jgi:hypothetical protein